MKQSTVLGQGSREHLDNLLEQQQKDFSTNTLF